jgi:hypothetical protein
VLLAGAFLFLRRRRTASDEAEREAPPPPAAMPPQPGPPAALTPPAKAPRPAPAPSPQPVPPQPAAAPRPLEMQLEARHLSRALVNATLAYRLTLTNRGEAPVGPLRIAGDIISAHASLTTQDQLALPDASLATIHQVAALAPGDSVTLSGELRLPLASILPISAGAARVFVPLARFRVEPQDGPAVTRVFVVGQASEQPGGALRPFPLDRGPGVDRTLGQRELELPA